MDSPSHRLTDLALATIAEEVCERVEARTDDAQQAVLVALWDARETLDELLERRRTRKRKPLDPAEMVDVAECLFIITRPVVGERLTVILGRLLGRPIDEDTIELARDIAQKTMLRVMQRLTNPTLGRHANWEAYVYASAKHEAQRSWKHSALVRQWTPYAEHALLSQRQNASRSRIGDVLDAADIEEMFCDYLPSFLEQKRAQQKRDRRFRAFAEARVAGLELVIRLLRRRRMRPSVNAMRLRAAAIVARGNRTRTRFDIEVPDKNTVYKWLRDFGNHVEESTRGSQREGVTRLLRGFFGE
jgi:hypothetical protein